MVFGPTDRPKIIQNHKKTRSKNRLVSGIDFGPLFLTFGLPKAPKSAPKSSQNAPKCLTIIGKNIFFDRPGPKMLQNGPRTQKVMILDSKMIPQSSKNDPKTTPTQKVTILSQKSQLVKNSPGFSPSAL